MMLAVALAIAMKPTMKLAENKPPVNLELMIPRAFADWKLDRSLAPIIASPDVQERLALIYNQTLSRTYVNLAGQRVMLSIAYGDNQATDDTQVHRPEFCYSAQGFRLENGKDDILHFQQTSRACRDPREAPSHACRAVRSRFAPCFQPRRPTRLQRPSQPAFRRRSRARNQHRARASRASAAAAKAWPDVRSRHCAPPLRDATLADVELRV